MNTTINDNSAKKTYVLRTCNSDLRSWNNFRWPESGPVECPDWSPTPECGNGLHGLLWGVGNGTLMNWQSDAKWLVVEVDAANVVDIGGKVKFPRGVVVYCGDKDGAVADIISRGATGPVVGAAYTAGDGGTATAGDGGAATAGYGGTATAGVRGTATAGDGGTATAGVRGTATAGDGGTATASYGGTATAGAGGAATAGYGGTATAGDGGAATAGVRGTAAAGDDGTATAGVMGVLEIRRWDRAANRLRVVVGYVGENGIEANVAYRLDSDGRFVRADERDVL